MYNKEENEEIELQALNLIDKAEELLDQDMGKEAIEYYEQAAQKYLDLGSYIKLDELYIRIADIISKFKNNIQAMYRLKSIIRKTEELDLKEISAKLLIRLGNVANEMNDWETAGDCFEKASNYLYESDPEEFYNLSSILLLKAGQALEKSNDLQERGKNLILKAVIKMQQFEEVYQAEEQRALHLLESNQLEAAASKFLDIASYFEEAIEHLGEIIDKDEEENRNTYLSARVRLIHLNAEYLTLSALCLRALEDRKHNDKIKELGRKAIELYRETIGLQKDYLLTKKGDYNQEELFRISFDAVLMSVVQGMLGKREITPTELLMENTANGKDLDKKLKETPYYRIAERIEKIGLLESLETLLDMRLGHLEKIKNTLISFFKKMNE